MSNLFLVLIQIEKNLLVSSSVFVHYPFIPNSELFLSNVHLINDTSDHCDKDHLKLVISHC